MKNWFKGVEFWRVNDVPLSREERKRRRELGRKIKAAIQLQLSGIDDPAKTPRPGV